MVLRRGSPLLAVLLLVGGLAACGDDDDDAATTDVTAATGAPASSGPSATSGELGSVTSPGGTDAPITSATTPASLTGADAEFCTPMQALATYNASTPPIDPTQPWPELQEKLIGAGTDAKDLYGAAVDAAPAEIHDDLQQMYDYSLAVFSEAEDASSLEEFQAALADVPVGDVLTATSTVGTYIEEHCGFSLTSS